MHDHSTGTVKFLDIQQYSRGSASPCPCP